MVQEIKYPKNYIAIEALEICSNKLVGGGNLIGYDNFSPLIIGKGTVPLIWLYTKINKSNWFPLITENKSNHAEMQIKTNFEERQITVKVESVILIDAKMMTDTLCVVDLLDLRPIGLNLFGDKNGLSIGNSHLNGNTFSGMSYMIGISEGEDETDKNISLTQ